MAAAHRRFRELYVAELTMVESPEVAGKMVELAKKIDPGLVLLDAKQRAALDLAGALKKSFKDGKE